MSAGQTWSRSPKHKVKVACTSESSPSTTEYPHNHQALAHGHPVQTSQFEAACEVCDLKFKHKRNISSHLKKIHGIKKCGYCSGLFKIGTEFDAHILHCG